MKYRIFLGTIGLAVSSLLMAGCREEDCSALDDLKVWQGQRYEWCCQRGPSDWGGSLGETQKTYNQMYRLLFSARIAGRGGDDLMKRQMLEEFYHILVGRATHGLGYFAIDGPLLSGGDIRNVFAVLEPGDELQIRAISGPPMEALSAVPMMMVGSSAYLQAAVGPAMTIKKNVSGLDPSVVMLDAGAVSLETTYSFAGGSVGVRAGAASQTHTITKGVLRIAEIPDGNASRLVPTDFKWDLSRRGVSTTITLDKACPYNEVIYADEDYGVVRMGVIVDGASDLVDRLEWLGTVWISLPFEVNADGSLLITTGGWSGASGVLPVSNVGLSVLSRDALGGGQTLPNNLEEACADGDGNGIRDGADALINIFDILGNDDCD